MLPDQISAPGIRLPPKFSRATSASLPDTRLYVTACIEFLTSPLVKSLLGCHPNDIAIDGPKPEWQVWWKWAAAGRERWKLLVPGWVQDSNNLTSNSNLQVPVELKQMLETVDQLTLPRTSDFNCLSPSSEKLSPLRGMSPKKSHEVTQMLGFIQQLVTQTQPDTKHIVDIGAGQGYLSRALCDQPLSMNVLALDSSEIQTKGAERRRNNIQKSLTKKSAKKIPDNVAFDPEAKSTTCSHEPNSQPSRMTLGTLRHELINITTQTLQTSVSHWISAQSISRPTPVILVALHACGSLTPDILRCFLECHDQTRPSRTTKNPPCWYAAGLVVVGCCYNLMSPGSDFPLSALVKKENGNKERNLGLSYNHRSLAAQSPLQWALDDAAQSSAELAVRKVVYRALFGKMASFLHTTNPAFSSHSTEGRPGKIGRLHDSAYSSVQEFVLEANKKMGVETPLPKDEEENLELTSCLEVLHTLRCRIGPIVESIILIDRYLYLTESTPDADVLALNLFKQELGSGRNMALVVSPRRTSL